MAAPKTRKSSTRTTETNKANQPNAVDGAKAPEAGKEEAEPIKDAATATDGPTAEATAANAGETQQPEQPPKPKQQGKGQGKGNADEIPAVFVRTRRGIKSRRRAGYRFSREGLGIALEALSAEELAAIEADPALEVEECTFPAEDSEAEQ